MVRELLVKNNHRATVESVPSTVLEAAIEGKEKGLLDEIKKSMTDQVRRSVVFQSLSRADSPMKGVG